MATKGSDVYSDALAGPLSSGHLAEDVSRRSYSPPVMRRTADSIPAPACSTCSVYSRAHDPSLPDTADNHTDYVKRRPVRLRSLPVSLAPDGVTIGCRAQEFRAEVRHPVEHRGPVASHLVAPSESSGGMGGLFALIICLQPIKERLQIVGVFAASRRSITEPELRSPPTVMSAV